MLRWFIYLPFGAVALLMAHSVGWAQEHVIHIALDKVDQVRLDPLFIRPKEGCRFDADSIWTSMKFVLNTASIPFTEGYSDFGGSPAMTDEEREKERRQWNMPALSVSGDVLVTSAGCIYRLEIAVSERVEDTRLRYSEKAFSGYVDLWSEGYYGITPSSNLSDQLSKIVEQALKEFVNLRAEDIKRVAQ